MIVAILVIHFLILAGLVGLTIRNDRVFKYREMLRKKVDALPSSQVSELEDKMYYLNEIMQVSYEEMVWKFWKPFDSFYKNTRLIARIKRDEGNK